jgi:histidyl-tRNA synthetase
MEKFERLKGFKDYYPEDMEVREQIFFEMRQTARLFGFKPIDYPSLEMLDIYRVKSGDELISQTYNFIDKGDREITLIPEATPSTMRMLVARKDLGKPVKWYNIPKLWRYEEPQSGRNREHYQFNVDYFGEKGPHVDAEVISLGIQTLYNLGLEGKFEVRINNRILMERILLYMGSKEVRKAMSIIDRVKKESEEDVLQQLEENGIKKENLMNFMSFLKRKYNFSELNDIISTIDPSILESDSFKEMSETMEILIRNDFKDIVYDPSTVRGLSYYTGIVFEGFDKEGKYRSIFGGGRYDNLSQLFKGPEIFAVGFGMGDAVLENLMKSQNLWTNKNSKESYYIIGMGEKGYLEGEKLAFKLRKKGKVACLDHSPRNISNSLKHGANLMFQKAIIIGDREIENKIVTIKDLRSGEQKNIPTNELLNE